MCDGWCGNGHNVIFHIGRPCKQRNFCDAPELWALPVTHRTEFVFFPSLFLCPFRLRHLHTPSLPPPPSSFHHVSVLVSVSFLLLLVSFFICRTDFTISIKPSLHLPEPLLLVDKLRSLFISLKISTHQQYRRWPLTRDTTILHWTCRQHNNEICHREHPRQRTC